MKNLIKDNIVNTPLFSGADHDGLLSVLKDCVIKTLEPGQFIFKYGDYGEDCGIVLSGRLRVEFYQKNAPGEAILETGDIFGEIAALSGYARTADIVALRPSTVLMIPRNTLLTIIDRFPSVKEKVDELYRQRVLSSRLRATPIFMGLPEDLISKLVERSAIASYSKGETVFRQGDEADAFYLVRYGAVKISETGADGRKKILAYLKAGHYFGEMALIREENRMATVTAIDRTELIRISRKDFLHITESYPRIKASLGKSMEKTEEKNVRIRNDEFMEKTLRSVIKSGSVLSKEILVIDYSKCIQCDSCVKACSALHNDQTRLVKKGIRLNNILLIATSCRHCYDPVCMIQCPTGAIDRGAGGEIYHRDSCMGCGKCARNCAYGNISMITLAGTDEEKNNGKGFFARYFKKNTDSFENTEQTQPKKRRPKRRPVKCDMCREHSFMACVYNCPTGAARRIDTTRFFSDVMGAG